MPIIPADRAPVKPPQKCKHSPNGHAKSTCVSSSDLEHLRASGLTDETIRANRLRTENGDLVFPYRHLDGEYNGFARRRLHNPPIVKGKAAKYLQAKGTPARAYFPAASVPLLKDADTVFVTEGEKKALALSQLKLAAIGLGGVDAGMKDGELIDDLAGIAWSGRTVNLVFDCDPKPQTRLNVNLAKRRLAKALLAAGAAKVVDVLLPPGNDGKMGVDDYLVAHGPFAFGKLVADAPDAIPGEGDPEGLRVVKLVFLGEPELDPAALYGLAGEFIQAVEPYTESTVPCILGQLLPAVASFLNGPRIGGTAQPARLNSLIVGETSTARKGTAFGLINRLMVKAVPSFWSAQKSSGLSSGEGLIARLEDRWEKDEDGNPYLVPVDKRLFVIEEEFASVLAHMRRDGNVLSHVIRCAFDSGDLETITINRRSAPGTHVCIVAHCTPDELRQRLGYVEQINGFANRFLIWAAHSQKILSKQPSIPDSVFKKSAEGIAKAYDFFTNRETGQRSIELSPSAQALWDSRYPDLRTDKPGLVGAMTARRAPLVLRLALVYWSMDNPAERSQIETEHLAAALAVIDYCQESVRLLFADRTGVGVLDRVLQLLRQKPMTKKELNTHFSNEQKGELAGHLERLEAQALIVRRKESSTGGRPATVWAVPEK